MKPRLRDYLTILMALLAIFLCGIGIGHMLGEKKGRENPPAITLPAPDEKGRIKWEDLMLERLDRLLSLSPDQREKVLREITITSTDIQSSRRNALQDYYRHLLTLHERLPAHLNREQEKKIKSIRATLRQAIELRDKPTIEKE
ncbi:MAG: hypothetical protein ACON5H_07780 [Akkermansiaceae bacterium]